MKIRIRMFVMDVDGTLTDGKIYISSLGELFKAFSIKDGYMIARLRENGIEPVIITGRESEIVLNRCLELGISHVYQGITNKVDKLREILMTENISPLETAYIGDDLNDMDCIEYCGLTACPLDAVEELKNKVNYVCTKNGGDGAVREFIQYILN